MYKIRCAKKAQLVKSTDQKKRLKNAQDLKFIF